MNISKHDNPCTVLRRLIAMREIAASFVLALVLLALVILGTCALAVPALAQEVETPPAAPPQLAVAADALPAIKVMDEERGSIAIVSYDLDLHLTPAAFREEARATLTVRNVSSAPLTRIPLQISGTLRWLRISTVASTGVAAVGFTQSPIATDADHTGYAQEAIVTPTEPLAVNGTLTLSVFYAGEIKQSAARLELLGTPSDRAADTDWDAIQPATDDSATALRGFGNVLWYPVAEPVAALGDGNKLFALVERRRAADTSVPIRLRLAVEYAGEPPNAAIFDGQLQALVLAPDLDNTTVAETQGVATAAWVSAPIGFRIPSLFLTAQPAVGTSGQLLNLITPHTDAIAPYAEAAMLVAPLLANWLGDKPGQLLLLDHPGEPFADHAFLAAQLAPDAQPEDIAPALVAPLALAWLPSAHPWITEGFAQFARLLYAERKKGHAAALDALDATDSEIVFVEPDLSKPNAAGQSLVDAISPTYFRLKAAFVWWQLRGLVGEEALERALTAYRILNRSAEADSHAFEETLESVTHTDLAWFFADWVYRDRGLPDLTIMAVNPRALPSRAGSEAGYLVAIEVRNDGDAVADVPVTLSSGIRSSTSRLRILPHSVAATRVVFEDYPETVQVNDGSVPEIQSPTHTFKVPSPIR